MNCIIQGGRLLLDIAEVLAQLGVEDKRKLATMLACDEDVLQDVSTQILDGWTEGGSHGYVGYEVQPYTALDRVRREIANRSGDVARSEIAKLVQNAENLRADLRRHSEWAYAMYRAWPENALHARPQLAEWQPAKGGGA